MREERERVINIYIYIYIFFFFIFTQPMNSRLYKHKLTVHIWLLKIFSNSHSNKAQFKQVGC